MKLKIAGFVENVRPYDVRIVAEGEGASVDLFVERARIKKSEDKEEDEDKEVSD